MTEMTFPYSQAPRTMKVLAKTIWICWFTLGNLVVVMVESIDVPDEVSEIFKNYISFYMPYIFRLRQSTIVSTSF